MSHAAGATDAPLVSALGDQPDLPDDLDDETVRQVRDRFSPEQNVEIVLKVLKFNTQKVMVALGTHTWLTPEQIACVRWNTEGTYVATD